ncbi:aldose epimerase family protein [Ruegeria arenilitoris]|uniref:aldose epimerase family protein n=1 Tax=Ruegeria arenilitoris TaxID=1173585 RepID=UPI0014808458|nr:aldose epimerase family protein [Ruegeria arenilitoris]
MRLQSEDRDPDECTLLTDGPMTVSLLSYGAITQGWWYDEIPLILGYDDPKAYLTDKNYMGAIVGRVANRIGGAKFSLGTSHFELNANEGRNTLHGGPAGLSHRHWDISRISPSEARLRLTSPDGDNGFPGKVKFEVQVTLEFPKLVYSFHAQPDRPTPISITQHNYYSLGSTTGISEHKLMLDSNQLLEFDEEGVPSGKIWNAAGTGLDFSSPTVIGTSSPDLDHYYLFDTKGKPDNLVAELAAPSGVTLSVFSDQPGAQVYSGAKLKTPFYPRDGLCIEPSGYPNAINIPSFPSVISTPENPYRQTLTLEISGCQT